MVAPPGLTDDARKRLMRALDRMHSSKEWKAELTTRGWTDAYLTGEEFGTFLTEQDERVADVLGRLGLA
jgi:putative tricarboxylic transport membrane protein